MASPGVLVRARAAGLKVTLCAGALRVRGARRLEALAQEVRAHEAAVIAALEAEASAGPPTVSPDCVPVPAWFIRGERFERGSGAGASREPGTTCFACGGVRWWRRIAGGPWVCPVCHPPGPPPHEIEWSTPEVRP